MEKDFVKNQASGVCRSVGSAKVYKYSTIAQKPTGTIPKAYVLPYLPDILDQGSVQSCVAHAIAERFQSQTNDKTHNIRRSCCKSWRFILGYV